MKSGMTLEQARSLSYDNMLCWEANNDYEFQQKAIEAEVEWLRTHGSAEKAQRQINELKAKAKSLQREFYGKF